MASADATVEVVEEVTEQPQANEPKQRGRKKGVKLFGHDKIYATKEEAKENEPYYAQEVTKSKKNEKGETVTYEDYDHDNKGEVDGFRIYEITDHRTNEVKYGWGRSGNDVLASFASTFCSAELVDAAPRGRQRKVDPIYVMFFKSMLDQGKTKELLETLKSQELEYYLPILGIDEQGNPTAPHPVA